ncbi:hypothetical protein A5658_14435 [Mycobacterium sp. 1245111.1]|uniref:hypothetical protein n=1 Tax=Mycobacterium sp. 1245111.1 TaxID=1834073 RepID=UPI0007FB8B81|nr:hypothetical protein [Mycobacterium sp. 1245111.1]OBK33176.1 hypothetical protein A5658_14435 [Mycobacterium sp. 1245111.1]
MTDITVGANAFVLPGLSASSPAALPRNRIGRRIANWIAGVYAASRAEIWSPTRRAEHERPHHHHREAFMEDAAMAREMDRL